MRTTLILATLLALFGVASAVQASDRSRDRDDVQISRAASHDGDRHERSEPKNARERHHDSRDGHDESHERHDESHEGRESRDTPRR